MRMEAMDTNSEVKPNRSLLGKLVPKSFSWYLDVRMARNMTKEVTEKQSATRDEILKWRSSQMRAWEIMDLSRNFSQIRAWEIWD